MKRKPSSVTVTVRITPNRLLPNVPDNKKKIFSLRLFLQEWTENIQILRQSRGGGLLGGLMGFYWSQVLICYITLGS